MTRVLVFGTFDGLHKGHESFLTQAKTLGNILIVCLARDSIVKEFKGKNPKKKEQERKNDLQESGLVDRVVLGDETLGKYSCIFNETPNIVAIGYDQTALKEHLTEWLRKSDQHVKIHVLQSFKPEIYKSSILNI